MKPVLPETKMQEIVDEMRSEGMALTMQSLSYGPGEGQPPTEEYLVVLAQGPMVEVMVRTVQAVGEALKRQNAPGAIETERIEYDATPDPMDRLRPN